MRWLKAFTLLLAVWLLFAALWPLDAIHPDSTHDLLMVRDCLELQRCDTAGPAASWRDIHHGALWLDLLALARTVWTPWGTGLAIALLNALAIVVTAHWLWRRQPQARAILPLLLATALLTTPVVLTMPTVVWPLALVATCLVLQVLERPHIGGFGLAGLLLGCAADLHAVGWPLVWAVACLSWHRSLRLGAALLVLVAVATTLAVSPRTWELLSIALPQHPGYLAALLGLPLVWLLLRGVRHWPPERQLALVGLLVWLFGGIAHQFTIRYLLPWSGALLLALAPLVPVRPAWIWSMRLSVLMLCLWRVQWGGVQLSYRAVQDVATVAQAHGLGWPDVLTGLRGNRAPLLAEASALYLPLERLSPSRTVQVQMHDGFVDGALPTTSRLQVAQTEVCSPPSSSLCKPLIGFPGPMYTPAPYVGRAIPMQLPLPESFAPIQLRIPVRAGKPTAVTAATADAPTHFLLPAPQSLRPILQPSVVDEPCDWRFANGTTQMQLDGRAQLLTLTCASLRHPSASPPRLLPGLEEACAADASCAVHGPELPPPHIAGLAPMPEPLRFNRTANEARWTGVLALATWLGAILWLLRRKPPVV